MIYDDGLNNIILKKLQRKGMEREFTLGVPAEAYIPIDDETLVLKQIKLIKYEELDNTAMYDVYNLEEYKKDLTWLKSEQGKLKSLERSSFKRLPHFSNKTLKQFLKENLIKAVVTKIKDELQKREISKQKHRNLKTELLAIEYNETHAIGAGNELERRKRRNLIGNLSECTDEQLTKYIEQNNEETLKTNSMVTRRAGKRKEADVTEQKVKKVNKKPKVKNTVVIQNNENTSTSENAIQDKDAEHDGNTESLPNDVTVVSTQLTTEPNTK
jgi:hypothetical protein